MSCSGCVAASLGSVLGVVMYAMLWADSRGFESAQLCWIVAGAVLVLCGLQKLDLSLRVCDTCKHPDQGQHAPSSHMKRPLGTTVPAGLMQLEAHGTTWWHTHAHRPEQPVSCKV